MLRSSAAPLARRGIRQLSNKSHSPLEGDSGALATHVYHGMTTFLVGATPLYFLIPTTGFGVVDPVFGTALAVAIAGHSWVGLNYVATDYVPKISKSLLGPARILNAAIGVVTLVGMTAIAWNGKGGIKGSLGALWSPKKKE
eukprot:CAMPEP_0119016356 /NCGR_PEP_ID=MMETSP1176-20130426/12414_1 /TAXON_ID=265551 /ORGANISM="Synedropsis recta cf, Strain CCMP1620" /LENGTH=141 /DNA_ID=CAMNT_0006969731 /DNA_START=69 /DNA_END=494 /DNA_ORIENTATION=-